MATSTERNPGYLKDAWTVARFGTDGGMQAVRAGLSRDVAEDLALTWSHRTDVSRVSCTESADDVRRAK